MVTEIAGPRRLVLQNVQSQIKPPPTPSVQPGQIRIESNSLPGLSSGDTYTATFDQSVNFPGASPSPIKLHSTKSFRVFGSPYGLDTSLIHSVYPPTGHADYWNVLPHVLFSNAQIPWLYPAVKADPQTPWLGLLVFSQDELSLTSDQSSVINGALGSSLDQTQTYANNLLVSDIAKLNNVACQPIPVGSAADPTPSQIIFLQPKLFSNLFGNYQTGSATVSSGSTVDLTRYKYMSHVRNFNADGTVGLGGNGESSFSAVVSPRTGAPGITTPTTMYAHLISLDGLVGNPNMKRGQTKPYALVSLYSWAFTYLPPLSFSVVKTFQSLGQNLQPLRAPDAALIQISTNRQNTSASDTWVKERKLAGYSLIKHRVQTGEPTIALQRGILTPVKFSPIDFPPSDYGSDLAIVDEKTGFLDLTFQLAWEIGRVSAMADRAISAALMRLRKDIHNKTLVDTKVQLDATFITAVSALSTVQSLTSSLNIRLGVNNVPNNNIIPERWETAPLGTSTRVTLSFQSPQVQAQYRSELSNGVGSFATATTLQATSNSLQAASSSIFDETKPPNSTDYATIFAWIMDRWFLQGIPFANVVPDPGFIPPESIRTFYIDQSWYKVFVDGALSVTEHYGEGDDVRESIKASLTEYLTTPMAATGYVPQIPKWGFLMRSEFVTKFPDMRIKAPWTDTAKRGKQAEILRTMILDTDLMCVLFDREPGEFDPVQGVSIQTPEHQLTSMFGSAGGVASDGTLSVAWKKVFADLTKGLDANSYTGSIAPLVVHVNTSSNGVYDSACQALCPYQFAQYAHTAMKWDGNDSHNVPEATPALVACQLTATSPQMTLTNPQLLTGLSAVSSGSQVQNSLSTSKARPNLSLEPAPSTPLKLVPPPKPPATIPVITYPIPSDPIVGAIGKTDLLWNADAAIRNFLFPEDPRGANEPPIPVPTPNPGAGTQLSTTFFNVRSQYFNKHDNKYQYKTTFITAVPQILGFKTDVHVSMTSCSTTAYHLAGVVLRIPVGSNQFNPIGFLAPFPQNAPQTAPTRNADQSYPLQPRNHSLIAIPTIRMTALGKRWNVLPSYTSFGSDSGSLIISLVPNYTNPVPQEGSNLPWWDVNVYRDLSFVIESVQVNCWGSASTFRIGVEELVFSPNALNGFTVNAGAAQVTVQPVDVRQPNLVFANVTS